MLDIILFQWAPADGSVQVPKPQAVKTVAVIGAGTMGTGIAMVMLNAGIPTILLEQNQEVRWNVEK